MKLKKSLFILMLAGIMQLPAVVSAGGDSRSGTITMEFDLSQQADNKRAQLWIPYPTSDAYQTISNIEVEGNYAEFGVYTDQQYEIPMLYASWPKTAENPRLTFSFDVERRERLDRDLPARETCWDPADYARYLASTSLGPVAGDVKKLADEITVGLNSVQTRARAVYDWICDNMHRDPDTRGCGAGDVCRLLQKPGGKCADISSVYVALARAAGVPAREVFGIRQGKGKETDISSWQHCWAEFFLPGYGWVVVDPADVLKKMLREELKRDDIKTYGYRFYFWGGVDPYRVRLTTGGRDLQLNPPQHGQPLNYFMYPFAQVGDTTLDWLDPADFGYSIIHTGR